MIHTRQLTRRFQAGTEVVDAVRGVDIDVSPGEIVAFLGPNGAGKSTTLHMLATLLAPTSGTAEVAGFDVGAEPGEVRRRIGHIGQGNGSHDGLRVAEELYYQGRFHELDRRTAQARTGELLDRLDLTDLAKRDVASLSGGQRRRLDVAMGLVHRPPLVFLDEPTSGLDPQSRSNLWAHLSSVREEDGATIFLTTHYLDEADSVAERVLVIDDGRIIADGTPNQLKAKVSGDLVTVLLPDHTQLSGATDVVHRLPLAHDVASGPGTVEFRVTDGESVLPDVVRALDDAGVRVAGTRVQRPSLDDVFLSLTGRSLREDT